MELTKAIKIAMVHKGISQKELAEASGVNETTISQTLTGKTKPNTKTLSRIAAGVGMKYEDLINLVG